MKQGQPAVPLPRLRALVHAGFWFFLVKGLAWLLLPALLGWWLVP